MDKITFINKSLGNEITLCRNEDNIYIRSERRTIGDPAVRDFIWKIGASYPNAARYDDLMEGISVGSGNSQSEAQRVFYRVKKFFEQHRSGHAFFENVRQVGYRVSDHWEKKEEFKNDSLNDLLMSELWAIVEEAIRHSQSWSIEKDKSGLSYIRAKSDYALLTFRKMNALYWEILEQTSRNANSIEILQLREPLFKLMSYLLFWRVGDRLDDDQWRSDYEREIRLLTKQIALIYQEI